MVCCKQPLLESLTLLRLQMHMKGHIVNFLLKYDINLPFIPPPLRLQGLLLTPATEGLKGMTTEMADKLLKIVQMICLSISLFCAPYKQVGFLHKLTHVRLALLSTSPEVDWTNVKYD